MTNFGCLSVSHVIMNTVKYIFILHTHTHNRFTALLENVQDHLVEQVPER